MSAFIYNVLTPAGAALIAQATAANPIVYVGALSKATAAESAEDLAVKDATWYDGKAGEIVAVSATDNVARPVAVWRNAGSAQPARSLCVTARLASQTDADSVVISAMSDPGSTVVLPGESDTGQSVGMPFPIAINSADVVAVTPGASASLADLERFLSLHSAGNPNVGDPQTVLGNKTFSGVVSVNDLRTDYIAAISGSEVAADADLIPGGTNFILGNTRNPWAEAHSQYFYAHQGILPYGSGTHDIGESGSPFDNSYAVNLYTKTISSSDSSYKVVINTDLEPSEPDNYIGSPSKPWGEVFSLDIVVYRTLYFSDDYYTVEAEGSCIFRDSQYYSKSIFTNGSGTHNIGESASPFDNIYAISLYGNHKSLYQVNDPVGGMYEIMVKISVTAYTASTPQTLRLLRDGQEIYVGMPLTASGVTAEISGIYNPLGADYTSTWRFCMIQALIVDVDGTGDVLMHRPYVSGDILALAIHTGSGRP